MEAHGRERMWGGVIVRPLIRKEKGVSGMAGRPLEAIWDVTRLRVGRPSLKTSGSCAWPTGPPHVFRVKPTTHLISGWPRPEPLLPLTLQTACFGRTVFVCCAARKKFDVFSQFRKSKNWGWLARAYEYCECCAAPRTCRQGRLAAAANTRHPLGGGGSLTDLSGCPPEEQPLRWGRRALGIPFTSELPLPQISAAIDPPSLVTCAVASKGGFWWT